MRNLWRSRRTGRKRRGTAVSELRSLFEDGITVAAICEQLYCVARSADSIDIARQLREFDFDVAGIAPDDMSPVDGYLRREDLTYGTCGDNALTFHETDLISDSTPLIDVLSALRTTPHRFVLDGLRISSIVTRADLQKPPIRILIFGLITLLEMNLSHLIRALYPDDDWQQKLSNARLEAASTRMKQRKERNEELELIDCLQFCDKRDLLKKHEKARTILDFSSEENAVQRLKLIEWLRDRVAHAQDLTSGSSWEEVIDTVADAEVLIRKCEEFEQTTMPNATNSY